MTRDFRKYLKQGHNEDFFFKDISLGRKSNQSEDLRNMIIGLRKQNFSAEDIVGIVNAKNYKVTYGYMYKLLSNEGFARLPRRGASEKKKLGLPKIKAPISGKLEFKNENLCLLYKFRYILCISCLNYLNRDQ